MHLFQFLWSRQQVCCLRGIHTSKEMHMEMRLVSSWLSLDPTCVHFWPLMFFSLVSHNVSSPERIKGSHYVKHLYFAVFHPWDSLSRNYNSFILFRSLPDASFQYCIILGLEQCLLASFPGGGGAYGCLLLISTSAGSYKLLWQLNSFPFPTANEWPGIKF